jgi:hypothetical protein
VTDSTTTATNHRYFQERIRTEVKLARRHELHLGLCLLILALMAGRGFPISRIAALFPRIVVFFDQGPFHVDSAAGPLALLPSGRDIGFTPQNKPAQNVIARGFAETPQGSSLKSDLR